MPTDQVLLPCNRIVKGLEQTGASEAPLSPPPL